MRFNEVIVVYKECELGTNKTYQEVMDGFLPALADFYAHPENYNIEPFRIFGNLYYVGDRKVCMHLVDTGAGLILFDSGYSHNYNGLIAAIERLGFPLRISRSSFIPMPILTISAAATACVKNTA